MAQKSVTINLPDTATYDKASDLNLAPSLRAPSAQGGNYQVKVGTPVRADQTSMGRLASALGQLPNVMNSYNKMADFKDAEALKEIESMTAQQKRDLIGQEDEVFRKMGIRNRNILRTKQALGEVEQGNFNADWTEHFKTWKESQGDDGTNFDTDDLRNEYMRYRNEWIGNSDVLGRSALAVEGFTAQADTLFARNQAAYMREVDNYYDDFVSVPNTVESMFSTMATAPETISGQWETLTGGMDATQQRKVLSSLVDLAKRTNTVDGYSRVLEMFNRLGSDKKAKLGTQPFASAFTVKMGTDALKEQLRAKKNQLSATEYAAEQRELQLKQNEAQRITSEYSREFRQAKGEQEKEAVTAKYRAMADQKDMDVVTGGLLIDAIDTIETNRELALTRELNAQKASDDKFINKLEADRVANAPFSDYDNLLDEQEEKLKAARETGEISDEAFTSGMQGVTNARTQTSKDLLNTETIDKLVDQSSLSNEIETSIRLQTLNSAYNEASLALGETYKNKFILRPDVSRQVDTNYQFNPDDLNEEVKGLFTDYLQQVDAYSRGVARNVYLENVPKTGTEDRKVVLTEGMVKEVRNATEKFAEKKREEFVSKVVAMAEKGKQREQVKRAAELGIPINDLKLEEKIREAQQLEAIIEQDGGNIFEIQELDGQIQLSFDTKGGLGGEFLGFAPRPDITEEFGERSFRSDTFAKARLQMGIAGNELLNLVDENQRGVLHDRFVESLTATSGTRPFTVIQDQASLLLFGKTIEEIQDMESDPYASFYGVDRAPLKGSARRDAERTFAQMLGATGISPTVWMNNPNATVEGFPIGIPEVQPTAGFLYRYKTEIPIIPQRLIEEVGASMEAGQDAWEAVEGLTSEANREMFMQALEIYTSGGEDEFSSLRELIENHETIYRRQGKSFSY